ncbi:hypothetical protein [Brumimicrobium aurantiacum]|uniref:Uncharacterized protein n=1 Tax=Brumimicrobium aurantiacum TaxID=1737063 RepID=A0A3E1EVS6_9FLAO|nr:hypothetical protein [Brumimicrobium aurantiacum]RFC53628.1 hypothetical protein DXU93_12760 [Brumimicrobium aurantiacum]
MPRCVSEHEHQKHIISMHTSHFHTSTKTDPENAHIGHEEHDDETSLVNILQHIFDDVDHPKEKCEFGFFTNVHHHSIEINSLAIIAVLKFPEFFIPAFKKPTEFVDYLTPNYSPPDRQRLSNRGPPFLLV